MAHKTATRFMNVAGRFPGEIVIMSNLNPTILYELAAPSTPDEIVDAVTEYAVFSQCRRTVLLVR